MFIDLHLAKLSMTDEKEYRALMEEFKSDTGYTYSSDIHSNKEFSELIRDMENKSAGIGLPDGFVPSTKYFLMDPDSRIYGRVSLRHSLNAALKQIGGHIGYEIRPSERRKGLGTLQLSLALIKAAELGLGEVLITCDTSNAASVAVIEKNGGILQWEGFFEPASKGIRRYLIKLDAFISPIMIKQLPESLEVIHAGFMTVAEEFGLNEQNCPTNGAFMKIDRLLADIEKGNLMYGLYSGSQLSGFVQLTKKEDNKYEINKLSVLPDKRHLGYGKRLLDFAFSRVRELGGELITIGIIEENKRLNDWYLKNGFVHTGTAVYPHLPFTVGYMEYRI